MKLTRVWLLLCLAYVCASAYARAPAITPWAPRRISTPQFESHAAFDPRNGDLYFVRSSPKFEGWRIFVSQCAGAMMVRSRAADICRGRRRSGSVVYIRWTSPLLHIDAVDRWRETRRPRHLAPRARC